GNDPRTVLRGFARVFLSLLALPALMRFFTWTTGHVADTSGGGGFLQTALQGAVAVGAMRGMSGGGGGTRPVRPARLGPGGPGGAAPARPGGPPPPPPPPGRGPARPPPGQGGVPGGGGPPGEGRRGFR